MFWYQKKKLEYQRDLRDARLNYRICPKCRSSFIHITGFDREEVHYVCESCSHDWTQPRPISPLINKPNEDSSIKGDRSREEKKKSSSKIFIIIILLISISVIVLLWQYPEILSTLFTASYITKSLLE